MRNDYKFFNSDFAKKSKFHWEFIKNIQDLKTWDKYSIRFLNWQKQVEKEKKKKIEIPKIIHQIWLGDKPKPEYYKRFRDTWLIKNPDFEYILWDDGKVKDLKLINQKLYNSISNPGAKSDVLRYELLYIFGGIYVDTDFECLKSVPNDLLKLNYVACMQFENKPQIGNSIIFGQKNSQEILDIIRSCKRPREESTDDIMNCTGPYMLTKITKKFLNNKNKNIVILPSNYCFPLPNFLKELDKDINLFITNDSFAIHHWEVSWLPKKKKVPIFKRIYNKLFKNFIKTKNL